MSTLDGKKILEIFIIFLFLVLNIISLSFLSIVVYNIICYADLEKYNLTFIVILITSITTSAFFLIKVYIENQLGIKEKEMLKEYTDLLKKQTEDQNLKFGELKNQNQQIINWINSTGIELHNDLLNRKNQQNPLQPNNNQTNQS